MNLKLRFQGPPLPADDHRRFRLPTTWDEYAKPKNEFYNEHVTPLVNRAHGLFNDYTLMLMRTFICLSFLMLIIFFPYVHTIRTDLFTNSDWEKITNLN